MGVISWVDAGGIALLAALCGAVGGFFLCRWAVNRDLDRSRRLNRSADLAAQRSGR